VIDDVDWFSWGHVLMCFNMFYISEFTIVHEKFPINQPGSNGITGGVEHYTYGDLRVTYLDLLVISVGGINGPTTFGDNFRPRGLQMD
jgi:hypothetical protein